MKLKEISSSTLVDEPNVEAYNFDLVGDDHISTSYDTPIRSDAFDISDKEKKNIIERHFRAIMETLGLDLRVGKCHCRCVYQNSVLAQESLE